MPTTKKQPHPDDVLRDLPVKLTEAELLEKGDRIADIEFEIDGLVEQRKKLNRKIKDLNVERHNLSRDVDTGTEERQVACRWQEDYDQNCKHLVRQDTGETIDTVALTADDRAVEFDFDGDGVPLDGDAEPDNVTPISKGGKSKGDAAAGQSKRAARKPKGDGKPKKK